MSYYYHNEYVPSVIPLNMFVADVFDHDKKDILLFLEKI